jgi:hypothetical protein
MRIASFDVGIRNLAYCVLDISPTGFTIVDWNVASIAEEELSSTGEQSSTKEPNPFVCGCTVGQGKRAKLCNKPATFRATTVREDNVCFCARHAKLETGKPDSHWIMPSNTQLPAHLAKLKMDALDTEYRKCFPNIDDKKPAKKADQVAQIAQFYLAKRLVEVGIKPKQIAAKDISLVDIGRSIKRLYDSGVFNAVTHVLIENQISTLASRMKTVQGLIAQTFIMGQDRVNIEFISSHNKLKGYLLNADAPVTLSSIANSKANSKTSSKTTKTINQNPNTDESTKPDTNPDTTEENANDRALYKARKQDGIRITERFIEMNGANIFSEKWRLRFQEKAKRDDLADCLLQAIWWLRFGSGSNSNKLISVADDLKINSVV